MVQPLNIFVIGGGKVSYLTTGALRTPKIYSILPSLISQAIENDKLD